MSDLPEITPRMRTLFVLGKLTPKLQSDLLADGTIEARWNIPVKQSLTIGNDIFINRTHLFSVLRACADGEEVSALTNDKGERIDVKASLKTDGAVVIELPTQHMTFTHAILISSDLKRRETALENVFRQLTVTWQERDRIRSIIRNPAYADSDFVSIAQALSSGAEERACAMDTKSESAYAGFRIMLRILSRSCQVTVSWRKTFSKAVSRRFRSDEIRIACVNVICCVGSSITTAPSVLSEALTSIRSPLSLVRAETSSPSAHARSTENRCVRFMKMSFPMVKDCFTGIFQRASIVPSASKSDCSLGVSLPKTNKVRMRGVISGRSLIASLRNIVYECSQSRHNGLISRWEAVPYRL